MHIFSMSSTPSHVSHITVQMGHQKGQATLNAIQQFESLRQRPAFDDDRRLWDLFDSLQPASCQDILGKWQGTGIDTGHWLLPALTGMKWHGKWFVTERDVKPLVCENEEGTLYSNLALNGEASLWPIKFRGMVSASVVYDGVPMIGHLRRIDEKTLLGVVDGKTLFEQEIVTARRHQFFYLRRVGDWSRAFAA